MRLFHSLRPDNIYVHQSLNPEAQTKQRSPQDPTQKWWTQYTSCLSLQNAMCWKNSKLGWYVLTLPDHFQNNLDDSFQSRKRIPNFQSRHTSAKKRARAKPLYTVRTICTNLCQDLELSKAAMIPCFEVTSMEFHHVNYLLGRGWDFRDCRLDGRPFLPPRPQFHTVWRRTIGWFGIKQIDRALTWASEVFQWARTQLQKSLLESTKPNGMEKGCSRNLEIASGVRDSGVPWLECATTPRKLIETITNRGMKPLVEQIAMTSNHLKEEGASKIWEVLMDNSFPWQGCVERLTWTKIHTYASWFSSFVTGLANCVSWICVDLSISYNSDS